MAEGGSRRGQLLRLAQELTVEVRVAARLAREAMEDAAGMDAGGSADDPAILRGATAALALTLHRWYSALEAMLERIERAFGTLPSGGEWHRDLLEGATWPIPGVRPSVLPRDSIEPLRELLRFRHFLRHAYAVELDPTRLRPLAAALGDLKDAVDDSLKAFVVFLTEAARRDPNQGDT